MKRPERLINDMERCQVEPFKLQAHNLYNLLDWIKHIEAENKRLNQLLTFHNPNTNDGILGAK